ncbi:hypothetical protein MVEN_00196700 [Mycena venus]|uniref:Uncharacterized protein n=1 Tax=Mycena venus TaxID=2733690 RepID=A0A8H6Z3P5_9AGAR|nr:hypothetical protein MVEN_00196700 [Mycena venus]
MTSKSEPTTSPAWTGTSLDGKPTWVLPSPFEVYSINCHWDGGETWGPPPKTLLERKMYELSWALRIKPDWQRKAKDPGIRRKWRAEAMEEEFDSYKPDKLSKKMIDYVLDELDGYAKIADSEKGIERGPFDAIWYSDRLFSADIQQQLKAAVSLLENVPDAEKDWHPGSDGKVLDLVHPSLYCIVYGRTHAYLPGKPRIPSNLCQVDPPPNTAAKEFMLSETSCWMPSDFTVHEDGSVKLVSPYINNLHPTRHRNLYPIIEEILSGFIPLWERVLGDINRENDREPFVNSGRLGEIGCVWGTKGEPWPKNDPDSDDDREEFLDEFFAEAKKVFPEANNYTGQLEAQFAPLSLRGRNIQCIVKFANIQLTPETPRYHGGSWHIEGMVNERIIASGIYYYDEENIEQSTLSFRVPTAEPDYHDQDDFRCVEFLYGIALDSSRHPGKCIQDLGCVVTQQGRALAWPNLFQHCVSPFQLSDSSKPGHRKILAIFLVDPTIDPVVSATDIPPQQAEWAADTLEEALADSTSNLAKLPRELADMVKERLPTTLMTLEEAKEYRLRLMKERTVFETDHSLTAYNQTFNMCEH